MNAGAVVELADTAQNAARTTYTRVGLVLQVRILSAPPNYKERRR